ncbi:hypothetical protein QYQ99_03290 [Comamonas testosteroni]|uniref:hypothetical protein n=1 Tax=Comamonas testosteroni TaxID=285 RepID=UPI00265DB9B4|nr:hypothetical protein [Comamonas testosteroni]WKL16594.1 hypothetical protein QYQ99_03290 [Comamonas testosteroni]
MNQPRLSPAMRTMLHNAIHGRPLATSLTRNSISIKGSSTLHALHRAGMLAGTDHQPTQAGRAYFALPEKQKAPRGA